MKPDALVLRPNEFPNPRLHLLRLPQLANKTQMTRRPCPPLRNRVSIVIRRPGSSKRSCRCCHARDGGEGEPRGGFFRSGGLIGWR
jgi:hypothetical protein